MKQQVSQRVLELENELSIDLDAVMHKTTQETMELIEALHTQNTQEIISELGDALFNTLSVAHRLDIQLQEPTDDNRPYTLIDLAIQRGKVNNTIQKHRWIYARSRVDKDVVQETTQSLRNMLIDIKNQYCPQYNTDELIDKNYQKFVDRKEQYTEEIDLRQYIRNIDNYPKEGIAFKDITPLLQSPEAFVYTVKQLAKNCHNSDVIVWLDARGFIFGAAVAQYLRKPFVLVRKKWKLPYTTLDEKYDLEYGSNEISIHTDAIQPGQKVAIVDDLLATGGTANAAIHLVEKLWGKDIECHFVIGLTDLPGKDVLKNHTVHTLIEY